MTLGKYTCVLLFPAVVAGLVGCERVDDGAGAYWDTQPAVTGGGGNGTNGTAPRSVAVAGDAIPANSIRYLHADVSGWPVTSKLDVSIGGGTVRMSYDKARVWPARGGLNANPWIIVNLNGQWTAATFEWFRHGQTSKPMSVVEGGHIKRAPLENFRPVSGEVYGWMVTSLARDQTRTVNERTNIVLATWP